MSETPIDDFNRKYIRLRTVLDGLEDKALRYCLEPKDDAGRVARAEELNGILEAFYRELPKTDAEESEVCPEGFFDCGGICVPYPCAVESR